MKIALKLLVSTLAGFILAASAQANVFVKDDRVQKDPMDPSLPMIRSVGVILNTVSKTAGSAWLVGEGGCYVATNYHVAFMKEKNPVTGDVKTFRGKEGYELTFLIGLDPKKQGEFADSVKARVVRFGTYDKLDYRGQSDDWAILKLDRCVGEKYGSLKYKRLTDEEPMPQGKLMTVGYPESRGLKNGITIEVGCKAQDYGPVFGLVGVDCAFEGGMSGGPILEQQRNGEWLVVGVIQGIINSTKEILPAYHPDRRNQMAASPKLFDALDKILGIDTNQAHGSVGGQPADAPGNQQQRTVIAR